MVEASIDSVSLPPLQLTRPNIVKLEVGNVIHRIHKTVFSGTDFNPCKGGNTRFAPIYDQSLNCIPTLYAAGTTEAAIYETILHDIPLKSRIKSIRFANVLQYQHSVLKLGRTLMLASLRGPDLMKWGVRRSALIGSASVHYEITARWAESIHDQFLDLDGMVWTSNLCDPDPAFLLFGDRVESSDLVVERFRDGQDSSFWADVRKAAQRGDIVLTS